MVKHQHASGEYNRRREECEEGVRLLAKWYPDIRALRDLSVDQLMLHSKDVPEKIFQRRRHVVEENERVRDGGRIVVIDVIDYTKLSSTRLYRILIQARASRRVIRS